MADRRPSVFIGSSSEGRKVAGALQVLLEQEEICDTVKWDQGPFGLSDGNLDSLVKALDEFDFAVLVTTVDDMRESRGRSEGIPRDNVVFEVGLFMGYLGRNRTFIVCDRNKPPALPSDLAGVTVAKYSVHASGNLRSSLGAVATIIREAIEKVGRRSNDFSRQLAVVRDTVIASGQTGPEEQGYFDKLSQLLDSPKVTDLALLYADIDGLRAVTRAAFREERDQRRSAKGPLPRRPESVIRAEFVQALDIAMTDAIYHLHPEGLKHDIFNLPDPDAVLIARDLRYKGALKVARGVQAAFSREYGRLWPSAAKREPNVTLLVSGVEALVKVTGARQAAPLHQFLRKRLKTLKDKSGRGRVFGEDDLGKPHQSS